MWDFIPSKTSRAQPGFKRACSIHHPSAGTHMHLLQRIICIRPTFSPCHLSRLGMLMLNLQTQDSCQIIWQHLESYNIRLPITFICKHREKSHRLLKPVLTHEGRWKERLGWSIETITSLLQSLISGSPRSLVGTENNVFLLRKWLFLFLILFFPLIQCLPLLFSHVPLITEIMKSTLMESKVTN